MHPDADTKQFVILVNTDAQLYKLRKSYEGKENVRISKTGVVDLSIKRGSYSRSLPPSMTPKPPVVFVDYFSAFLLNVLNRGWPCDYLFFHRERVPYTAEDEENMVRWLATRMPHKADGGRAGNLEWQELCSRAAVRSNSSHTFSPSSSDIICIYVYETAIRRERMGETPHLAIMARPLQA